MSEVIETCWNTGIGVGLRCGRWAADVLNRSALKQSRQRSRFALFSGRGELPAARQMHGMR